MAPPTCPFEKPEPEEENDVADPGSKEFIPFTRPGLVGGTYAIQVQQAISEDKPEEGHHKEMDLTTYDPSTPLGKQPSEVLAPRFDLPTDSVYSIYPEQGHEATHDTLPHIVLNDSTLPWERTGSYQAEGHRTDDYSKHAVPWMALLIFSPDELRLDDVEKAGIFAHTSLNAPPPKQSESMAVRVPLGDLVKLKEGTASVPFDDQIDLDQAATEPNTNLIFPKASLFNRLFAAYDDNGEPQPGTPDISRHRFLAHVVRMNTRGTDSDKVDTPREFSVVLANRIGPLDGDTASQMIVHLVSLEGVESLNPLPLPEVVSGSSSPEQPARVGLVSLYSWSYTCLPPNSLNVKQTIENLALTASMLKPIIPPHSEHLDDAAKRMLNRFEEGYTIVRSRTPTGEPTAALIRGPLTPNLIAPLEGDFLSNSGADLKIFDEKLDMMDITYSSAWSLGRSLALADRAFTVSLTRVRHEILHPGTSAAQQRHGKMPQATQRQSYKREDLLKSLDSSLINETSAISRVQWPASTSPPPNLANNNSISPVTESAKEEEAVFEVAKSLAFDDTERGGWKTTYDDDLTDPSSSSDWSIVLRFVLDLYRLVNVPSRYLLPGQSMLPRESLRFFFVDGNWIDALVDGALSVGYMYQGGLEGSPVEDDHVVRRALKKSINRFMFTDDPTTVHHHRRSAAVPRYGFFLRSSVIAAAQFPDLKVSVEQPSGDPNLLKLLLRHDIVAEETMLGFFSEAPPVEGELYQMRFEVPAHQQFFSLGSVTDQDLEVVYKKQYTTTKPKVEDRSRNVPAATIKWPRDGKGKAMSTNGNDTRERSQVFIWGSKSGLNDVRLVLVEKLAADVHATLVKEMAELGSDWYEEMTATSAVMAYQLSSRSWQLQIG